MVYIEITGLIRSDTVLFGRFVPTFQQNPLLSPYALKYEATVSSERWCLSAKMCGVTLQKAVISTLYCFQNWHIT
jgi:hypothetical protein